MANDKDKYSREEQAARTRSAEVGKGKSTLAGLNAKNPMSSARGPYQMLDSTWKDMEKSAGHKLDRNSQEDNELAFQLYTKRSEKALEQNGLEVNPGNTYALHVYGPKGGVEFLKKIKANPNGLAIDGMSREVINGNKPFFYDKNGKPRTNSDSYNTLSTRVGGPNDPGAITLQKNLEREQIYNDQQAQIAQQQQIGQEQAQQQQQQAGQDPDQVQEEQATDPNQVQNQQAAPVEETSQLSRASNKAGVLYTGDRTADANFILPEEPIQEDVKTSGDSVQKMKTFAYGGVSSTINKKSDPPFPKIKSVAETLTGKNIPGSGIPIIAAPYTEPAAPRPKTIDNLYSTYHSVADKKLDTLTMNDNIRKSGENITLREGRSRGRKVDKALLNAIDDAEKRNNLNRGELASLIKREEDFKYEEGSSNYDLRDVSNYYKVNAAVTGLDPLRYLADKKVPGVKVIKSKTGYQFERTDDDAINKHLASNPKMAAEYEKLLNKSVPTIGKKNTLDFIARDLKASGNKAKFIKEYNPGDPNYSRMVAEDAAQLTKEPEYNKYLDTRRKLATNGTSSRGNNLAYGGQVNNDTTLSGKNDGLLNEFNEGGSHENNPNGGVFQGVSKDGVQNTVEEGETKMGDYVFSNRLTLDEKDVENLYLPRETKGMTYADASKFINSFLEENPFDFIVKRTVTGQLESLKIGNDRARRYKEEEEQLVQENEIKKETRDNPELQSAVLSEMNAQSLQQENSSSEEEIPEEISNQTQYNFGGYIAARDSRPYENGTELDVEAKPDWLSTNAVGMAGAASAGIGMGMNAFKKIDSSNVLAPDIEKVGVGGAMAKGAAEGALAGASLGPYGALAGAAVGGILGGIGAGNQNKAANKQSINKSDYAFNMASREVPETVIGKYGGMQKKYALGGDDNPGFPWFGNNFKTNNSFSALEISRLANEERAKTAFDPNVPLYTPNALGFATKAMAPTYQLTGQGKYSKMLQDSINRDNELSRTDPVRESNFSMKGTSPLQYAEGIGSLANYLSSRKERPRQIRSEGLTKLSSPKYYDEAYLQTQLGKETNNLSQSVLATAGGSAASARAMSLAGMNNLNKLKSDAYFKMDEVNRGVYDRDQAESQRIADANVGIRNQDYQANLQEEDYTRARKDMARDNLIKSVGNLGREQSDRNLIYNITGGYNPDGSYDPEGKNTLWNRGIDLYSRIKGQKSKGGLIDAYEKASTMDEKELALDYLNKKYNGKI
jgi:hypothetical protein